MPDGKLSSVRDVSHRVRLEFSVGQQMKRDSRIGRCAVRGCPAKIEDSHGFCTKHADEIYDEAVWQVDDVLGVASELYLGRTDFPERRLLEHFVSSKRDFLLVLHWTANWAEAKEFEEGLIHAFKQESKYLRIKNESLGSEGRYGSPWNAVYISFALKNNAPRELPGSLTVEYLHWRNRLWPNPVLPNPPVLLCCRFTKEEAEAEIARFKAATDPARPTRERLR